VDVVDDEIAGRRSRAIIHHLAPRPASPLGKHDVTRDAHTPCRRVEDAVGLGALRVADEDPWRALVVELADVVELLDEGQAAEDAKVAHRRLAPVPGLVWCLAIEGLGGGAIEQVGGSHHRLVVALDDAVLLRSVWRREVAVDPLIGAVRRELGRRELAAVALLEEARMAAADGSTESATFTGSVALSPVWYRGHYEY
jgi:hypothetical protein